MVSAIYYEGTVSATEESFATLGIPNFSASEEETSSSDMEDFFDESLSAEGDATGDSFTADYDVTFGTLSFFQ